MNVVALRLKGKVAPSSNKIETIELAGTCTALEAKVALEAALGIPSDPHSFIVVLPTASYEGYILTPERKMIDLLTNDEIEFSDVILCIYHYPALVQVGWFDKPHEGVVRTRTLLMDKSAELRGQGDVFWELFEKGKKKDELVVKHYSNNDYTLLNTNFNLIHYKFEEQMHTLMVGTLTTYKKQKPIENAEFKGPLFYHVGALKDSKKKYFHAVKHQTALYLTKSESDKKILDVIILDSYDYRSGKLEDGSDTIILEKTEVGETKKTVIYLQPEDKTKLSIWQDLIRIHTKNTATKIVFGVPLPNLMSRPLNLKNRTPQILNVTLQFLDNNEAMGEVGIFRKTGNLGQIERYITRFDSGEEVNLAETSHEYVECHTATGLVKKWLGRLPEPLLTPYQDFIDAFSTKMDEKVLKLTEQLPLHNLFVLSKLCSFLHKVVGPNALRPPITAELTAAALQDSGKIAALFAVLIRHHETKLLGEQKSDVERMQEKKKAIQRTITEQKTRNRPSLFSMELEGTQSEPGLPAPPPPRNRDRSLSSASTHDTRHKSWAPPKGKLDVSSSEEAQPTLLPAKKLTKRKSQKRVNAPITGANSDPNSSPEKFGAPIPSNGNSALAGQLYKMLLEEKEAREKLQVQVQELLEKVNGLEHKVKGLQSKTEAAAMDDVMSMLKF